MLVRIQRCHATRSGTGDRLAVDLVLHITGSEHAGDAGCSGIAVRTAARLDVAIIHFQLPGKDIGIGLVTYRDEYTLQRNFFGLAALHEFDTHPRHAAGITEHFVQRAVELQRDFSFFHLFHQVIDHDALGAVRCRACAPA